MDHFDPLASIMPKHPQDILDAAIPPSDNNLSQAQAASMRRKKNADAQAAFRARRANYIASLEETVTSLEAVVLSLQDACREARNDADDFRHENTKLQSLVDALKQAGREREKDWRNYWHDKSQTLGLDINDLPPPRPSPSTPTQVHPPPSRQHHQYLDDSSLRFSHTASATTPSSADAGDPRYAALQPFTSNPEGNWIPGPFSNTRTPCVGGEPHPSQSSEASDSPPSLSPGVPYSSRFPLGAADENNRMSLVNISMPYEPSALGVPHDYASEAYHGRNALSESERYSTGRPRRAYSGPHARSGGDLYAAADAGRATPPLQVHESDGLHHESSVRPRRHTTASLTGAHSRSTSPVLRGAARGEEEREAPMSNTLAVIKAQAFGSLRRTRTRVKKGSDGASKVAIDILAARGIGMGVQVAVAGRSHKRKAGDAADVDMGPA